VAARSGGVSRVQAVEHRRDKSIHWNGQFIEVQWLDMSR
jgi:hypothetical protein